MRINRSLIRMNRNLLICLAAAAAATAVAAEVLSGYASYVNASATMVVGYAAFFGTLTVLFWRDNRNRYGQMDRKSVRQELAKVVSSIGIGEIIYFTVGWFTLYYLLDVGLEPYAAALISRAVAASIYLPVVSVVLKAAKTY